MVNDGEARELSGDWNIHRAGRWILAHGPKRVVIKQGEHGALLIEPTRTFYVPAFPLENVFDPTGAGDAFAGGFMAYLARSGLGLGGQHPPRDGRTAPPWAPTRSSSSASGASRPSRSPTSGRGSKAFADLTHVSLAEELRVTSAGEYAAAGVDLAGADEAKARIGVAVAGTRTALSVGKVGAFGGMVRVPAGHAQADARAQHRRRRHQGAGGAPGRTLRHRGRGPRQPQRQRHPGPRRHADRVHGLHRGLGARRSSRSPGWSRGSRAAAGRTAWRSPAARRRRCRASTSRAPTISRGRSSAWSRRTRRCTATPSCRATCCSATRPPACTPTATRSPAASSSTG